MGLLASSFICLFRLKNRSVLALVVLLFFSSSFLSFFISSACIVYWAAAAAARGVGRRGGGGGEVGGGEASLHLPLMFLSSSRASVFVRTNPLTE